MGKYRLFALGAAAAVGLGALVFTKLTHYGHEDISETEVETNDRNDKVVVAVAPPTTAISTSTTTTKPISTTTSKSEPPPPSAATIAPSTTTEDLLDVIISDQDARDRIRTLSSRKVQRRTAHAVTQPQAAPMEIANMEQHLFTLATIVDRSNVGSLSKHMV